MTHLYDHIYQSYLAQKLKLVTYAHICEQTQYFYALD